MDVNTLAVALISVVGTLGGTLGGAVVSQRARRGEVLEENRRADREREEEREERAMQVKRDLYAQLNSAARAYRVAARDAVEAAARGESVDPGHLDAAKEAWAEQYSVAQMTLAEGVLEVASSVNRSLGIGYAVVKQLPASSDLDGAFRRAKAWFHGPLSDGVFLLRLTLRHDLGVEIDQGFRLKRVQGLSALDRARDDLARLLEAERVQAGVPATRR